MTGMQRTQQESIEHKASNRALTRPAESQDKRGTKSRTLGLLHEAPWLPTSSDASKGPIVVVHASDERFTHQGRLKGAMMTHLPNPLGPPSGSIALTGTAKQKAIEPTTVPQPAFLPGKQHDQQRHM